MSAKKDEILGVRVDSKMKKEIEVISKALHTSPSEWVRTKIAQDLRETLEDMKYQLVLEYMRGTIDREELEEVFGDMAEEVDYVVKKVKEDFVKAEELAEQMD